MLGELHLGLQQAEEAAAVLERSIELFPDLGRAYYMLAVASAHLGRWQEVGAVVGRLRQLEGTDPRTSTLLTQLKEQLTEIRQEESSQQ